MTSCVPSTRAELMQVLRADLVAQGLGSTWRWRYVLTKRVAYFERLLRVAEYRRTSTSRLGRLRYYVVRIRLQWLSERMGFDIPLGVFEPGLSIAHRGTIVVNGEARVGANCRIHQCVTIGAVNGKAPRIGSDVFIGAGAGLFGDIKVGSGSVIGPGALVVSDVPERGTVVGCRGKLLEHRRSESSWMNTIMPVARES